MSYRPSLTVHWTNSLPSLPTILFLSVPSSSSISPSFLPPSSLLCLPHPFFLALPPTLLLSGATATAKDYGRWCLKKTKRPSTLMSLGWNGSNTGCSLLKESECSFSRKMIASRNLLGRSTDGECECVHICSAGQQTCLGINMEFRSCTRDEPFCLWRMKGFDIIPYWAPSWHCLSVPVVVKLPYDIFW